MPDLPQMHWNYSKTVLCVRGVYCPYGDRYPKWCPDVTPYRCYNDTVREWCCDSCTNLRNSSNTDCEYGDKFKNCEDLIYPYACYHPTNEDACCGFCSMYASATEQLQDDCKYGDKQAWCWKLTLTYEETEWCPLDEENDHCCGTCRYNHSDVPVFGYRLREEGLKQVTELGNQFKKDVRLAVEERKKEEEALKAKEEAAKEEKNKKEEEQQGNIEATDVIPSSNSDRQKLQQEGDEGGVVSPTKNRQTVVPSSGTISSDTTRQNTAPSGAISPSSNRQTVAPSSGAISPGTFRQTGATPGAISPSSKRQTVVPSDAISPSINRDTVAPPNRRADGVQNLDLGNVPQRDSQNVRPLPITFTEDVGLEISEARPTRPEDRVTLDDVTSRDGGGVTLNDQPGLAPVGQPVEGIETGPQPFSLS